MSAHEDDRKVRVCIRVRPPLASEPQDTSCLSVEPETATVALHKASAMTEKFKVDRVFGTDASTPQLYDTEIAPLVSRALERGANATVFAYGVTGSGKTFTMQGGGGADGLIQPAVRQCMDACRSTNNAAEEGSRVRMDLSFSFVELYNDRVFDLLQGGSSGSGSSSSVAGGGGGGHKCELTLREDASRQLHVIGMNRKPIVVSGTAAAAASGGDGGERGLASFMSAYHAGCKLRRTGATGCNETSSRSHSLIMFHVSWRVLPDQPAGTTAAGGAGDESEQGCGEVMRTATVSFIDLAGSEDNRLTENSGARMRESGHINTSLFTLGKVLSALNSGPESAERIPFRDSKLTRILQSALCGSSHTALVSCVAPNPAHHALTAQVLSYSIKALNICNRPDLVQSASPAEQAGEDAGLTLQEKLLAFKQKKDDAKRQVAEAAAVAKKKADDARKRKSMATPSRAATPLSKRVAHTHAPGRADAVSQHNDYDCEEAGSEEEEEEHLVTGGGGLLVAKQLLQKSKMPSTPLVQRLCAMERTLIDRELEEENEQEEEAKASPDATMVVEDEPAVCTISLGSGLLHWLNAFSTIEDLIQLKYVGPATAKLVLEAKKQGVRFESAAEEDAGFVAIGITQKKIDTLVKANHGAVFLPGAVI